MSSSDIEHRAAGEAHALRLLVVEMLVASCRSRARYHSYYAQMLNRLSARSQGAAALAGADGAATACVDLLRELIAHAETEFGMRRRPRLTGRRHAGRRLRA